MKLRGLRGPREASRRGSALAALCAAARRRVWRLCRAKKRRARQSSQRMRTWLTNTPRASSRAGKQRCCTCGEKFQKHCRFRREGLPVGSGGGFAPTRNARAHFPCTCTRAAHCEPSALPVGKASWGFPTWQRARACTCAIPPASCAALALAARPPHCCVRRASAPWRRPRRRRPRRRRRRRASRRLPAATPRAWCAGRRSRRWPRR